jgi:glycosyltransferase involved in cell wall biosynthesis
MTADRQPAITVVIPTRERPDTLQFALRSALQQESRSYQVLVSDNFSQDRTRELVAAAGDPRVKYVNTGRRLSMCDNWEFALQQADGRYLIFIGDDDAILPGAIDRLQALIADQPFPAYMWNTPIYCWPIQGAKAFVEYLPEAPEPHAMDLVPQAREVLAHGGWRYYLLPGAYHAAVSRDVYDAIRKKLGRVFLTTQPDLFTGMAVPAFSPRAWHVGAPVTLNGRSAASNGRALTAKDGAAVLERFIREYGDYKIHPRLFPGVPLKANLIADAILVAKDSFPEIYGDAPFNFNAMWGFLYKMGLLTKTDVLRHRSEISRCHPFSLPKFLAHAAFQDGARLRRSVLNRFRSLGPLADRVPDNIHDFARAFADWKKT